VDLVHLFIVGRVNVSVPGMFLKPGWRLYLFQVIICPGYLVRGSFRTPEVEFLRTIDNLRLDLSPFQIPNTVGANPPEAALDPSNEGSGRRTRRKPVYHSLATLLGTWSQELRFRRPVENPTCLTFS